MTPKAIQDYYPDAVAICYGCGRNNPQGLHIRTVWDGQEGIFRFTPLAHHTAFPGVVYGGLIASLIDCHSIGTAVAAAYQSEGREPGSLPEIMFVTANLNVSYLKPTPMNGELLLRARPREIGPRKMTIVCSLNVGEMLCARGEVVAVRVPSRADATFGR